MKATVPVHPDIGTAVQTDHTEGGGLLSQVHQTNDTRILLVGPALATGTVRRTVRVVQPVEFEETLSFVVAAFVVKASVARLVSAADCGLAFVAEDAHLKYQ